MPQTFVYIAQGLLVALTVIAIALPLGFVLGGLLAILRVYGGTLLSRIVAVYSAVMRGVPPIVLLFILYFVVAGAVKSKSWPIVGIFQGLKSVANTIKGNGRHHDGEGTLAPLRVRHGDDRRDQP